MTGPLALVGSGEFTPAMRALDARLLDDAEAAGFDRVVAVVPTAAAPDGEATYRRWFEKAHAHYAELGAEVLEVDVRERADALALGPSAEVAEAGFVYLSGGKPAHLTAVLRDTPLLDAVLERWRLGAPLAGCSAGAMALAAGWPPFFPGSSRWGEGLGVLPDLAVVPHFDFALRMAGERIARAGRDAPPGWRTIGVDEDTALLRTAEGWSVHGAAGAWELTRGAEVVPLDPTSLPGA